MSIDRDALKTFGWSDELVAAAMAAADAVVDQVVDGTAVESRIHDDVVVGAGELDLERAAPAGSVQLHIR